MFDRIRDKGAVTISSLLNMNMDTLPLAREYVQSSDTPASVFNMVDSNGDGTVSVQEIQSFQIVGDENPEWTNLDVGCLDRPERVVPTLHQCVESRLPWYRANEELPQLRSEELPELVEAWKKAER